MGDNIVSLTSLPYAHFDDELSDGDDLQDPTIHDPNAQHSSSHEKKSGLKQKFHSLTKEKKATFILASALVILSVVSIVYASIDKSQRSYREHVKKCEALDGRSRLDAGLGLVHSARHCLDWGGCWDKLATKTSPQCYYPQSNHRGYRVKNSTVRLWGMEIYLERIDKLEKLFASEADELKCVVSYETDSRLRVKIFDPKSPFRYEVPMNSEHSQTGHRMQYILTFTEQLFGFAVSRTHEATSTIFNTTVDGLIFSDQLLQLNMMLSSSHVYGLGGDSLQRTMDYKYDSLWAQHEKHGSHPFLLQAEKDGHASGIMLQNSNAMDVILNPHPAVTFRTTGGILDFYIFLGPNPTDVISQLNQKIGLPFVPPLWALGYHFGSDNFQSTADIDFEGLQATPLPLDGLWVGQSFLKNNEEFTVDIDRFPDITDKLRNFSDAAKFLMEVRPAVLKSSSMYDKSASYYIRDHANATLNVEVESGESVLLDYFHPDSATFLNETITKFLQTVPFHGLQLEDNEPFTKSDGSVTGCSQNKLDNPIYTLKGVPKLQTGTVCPSARHHGDYSHYDVHNIYGWKSSVIVKRVMSGALSERDRSVLLSRSSYLGSGTVAGYFLKENTATWADMANSIVVMLNYNMYGIPFVGANICGYHGNPELSKAEFEELCIRWHQLAVFYPFTKRFHSQEKTISSQYSDPTVTLITQALQLRYRMLPTLQTTFFNAHLKGLPVVRPLFFEYLNDPETLAIDNQFMLGSGIMVAPVLNQGITEQSVYFPEDIWYDYLNPLNVIESPGYSRQKVFLDEQTYYIRGGHMVISYVNNYTSTAKTELTNPPLNLDIYLDGDGHAFGEMFLEKSGNSVDIPYCAHIKFNATSEYFSNEVTLRYAEMPFTPALTNINIRGLKKEPTKVVVDDRPLPQDFSFVDGELKIDVYIDVTDPFHLSYT